MHIAEGILPLTHALAWAALAAPLVALSAHRVARLLREGDGAERALLGMAGALTFAVTLFPVPVPIAGVTSHMCATPVLALLLGPRRMVLPAALTLLLQAILFAHGGLTSLGANVLTLGVVGPLVGARDSRRHHLVCCGKHLFTLVAALPLLFTSRVTLAQPSDVTPPKLRDHGDVAYPPSEEAKGGEVKVVLFVTVERDGSVGDSKVAESGGDAFDSAALEAVKGWRFEPATRAGAPIRTRIRVPIQFAPTRTTIATLPLAQPADTAPSPPAAPAAPAAPLLATTPLLAATPSPVVAAPVEVTILGRTTPPSRGASDFSIHVGELARIPRKNAAALLTLAPGFFLTNEGGEGHAERVYLRGFDAREGQDIEFSIGGVPINESGNLHGNGYADLGFIIPELIDQVRVLEGPFDPRQGNYAVAGSADYSLGLPTRGLTAKYAGGSFGSQRMLLLWGPPGESDHTFAGVEIHKTDGFGQNRDAKRATAMGQYEGRFGVFGTYRIGGSAYLNEYHQAGLLREDDVLTGRKGFFDTYDTGQGGGGSRYQINGDIESRSGSTVFNQQIFLVRRGMRLRENFTGSLLDYQTPLQSPHGQRGDLFDLEVGETTLGARGFARTHGMLFGQRQELELGYFARGDLVDATRQRIDGEAHVPYKTDSDLRSSLGDIGMYADATLRATPWLALRGGARADLFAFDVLDACAVKGVSLPSLTDPPGDASCLDQQRGGAHREPTERSSTASMKLMPRASLIVGPIQSFTLSLSYGTGVRSIDPGYITQDVATPFASITAYEGGMSYARSFGSVGVAARSILFATHVDKDLVFSESEGRNTLGGGTTRTGWSGSVRVTGDFFDQSANITFVKSVFDDSHLLVPYVPDVVLRSDTALFHEVPFKIVGTAPRAALGAGITYIGRRALPYGQRSDTIFTLDGNASIAWRDYELGVAMTNLLDTQYRLAEYNFVSDFRSTPDPTLVAARHFAAGAPRSVMLTLSASFGGS